MSTQPSEKSALIKALVALATAAAIILYLFWYTGNRRRPETGGSTGHPTLTTNEKADFFKLSVGPILDANTAANARALDTLKAEIHRQFGQYRSRVPAFTEDITGIGNKTTITWEALRQMVSADKEKVKRHVKGKFEMHVVSAAKMDKDLGVILHSFRRDIEANKNRMLADIETVVKNDPRFSQVGVGLPESFAKDLEADISAASLQAGKDSVVLSGMRFLVSLATEEATRALVTVALTRVGTSLAASMGTAAVTTGGATVAGGVGGGATGSMGGPVCTAIGLGAGLVVGVAVDWVMTERMETKLNGECTEFLTKVETALTDSPDGIVSSVGKAVAEIEKAKGDTIKQQIVALP